MYEISQLFFYRPLFMVQLLGAEFLFASQLTPKSNFFWRLICVIAVCIGVSFLFPLPSFAFNAVYSSFMFFSMFAVTLWAFKFLYNASIKDVIFCTIAGYTVQHIAQEGYELFNVAFNLNNSIISIFYSHEIIDLTIGTDVLKTFLIVLGYCVMFVALYWLAFELFAKKIKKFNILNLKTTLMLVVVIFIVMIDIVFSSIITYTVPSDTSWSAVMLLHIYNIACCGLALILLFEWPHRKNLESEITAMNQLRYHEKQQYFISKENIELINIKCHDMKHQLRRIAEHNTLSNDTIREMSDIISIYDSTYKTANEAMNVILTEKGLICKKNEIALSCIVDGEKLDFMSETDIYSLFGNLLENSIEAVSDFEKEKRSIGLSVKGVNDLVVICIYNYYVGNIKFESELPITTKNEKNYHGFGLKSIRYIVNKYGGELNIRTDNNIFSISIVLPIKRA